MNEQAQGTDVAKARRVAGFTLIEVMITVAIVAILASIALPAYTSHVARARRADLRGQMLQAQQFMQRFYAANDQFEKDRSGNDVYTKWPDSLKRSPADGTQVYTITVSASDSSRSYTITGTPVSPGPMASDSCGTYTLTNTGSRTPTSADCWK